MISHKSIIPTKIKCAKNFKNSVFCRFQNRLFDFSQVSIIGDTRNFQSNFFNIQEANNGDILTNPLLKNLKQLLNIPGDYINNVTLSKRCDIWEERPVFISSNDDIYNLGHFFEDLMTTWVMIVMSQRYI